MRGFRKRSEIPIITLAVVFFLAAGLFHRPLLRLRHRSGPDMEALTGAPPVVVFTTVVLGGFRGVIADALWLRASYLQEEERYLELVQLADWVTKLEPRTTDVWAFHAWNMAYNVSVMMPIPEDRWRWVQQGIRLLRDDGIRYNPTDPRIYQELGWLFQHKVGGDSDRLHAYYKQQLSQSVAALLGPNGRANYDALALNPAQRERIKTELGMDVERMQVVDAIYGPLDWRVAQSHSLYWAYQGLQVAGDAGYLPCSRMIYQAMAELFLWGRQTWAADGTLTMEADTRLLPHVWMAYEDAIARYDEQSLPEAYANFLAGATLVLADRGSSAESRRCYDRLAARFQTALTANGYENFLTVYRERIEHEKVTRQGEREQR